MSINARLLDDLVLERVREVKDLRETMLNAFTHSITHSISS